MNLFEHILNWLVAKFFPSKELKEKPTPVELLTQEQLVRDRQYYEAHIKELNTLLRSRDYVRGLQLAERMSSKYWQNMSPEKYASLIRTPNVRECTHRKGMRKPGPMIDYNIMDHTFPTGVRVVKCLNNCGWKASPGDDNWPLAVQMLKKTSNTASASEVSSMVFNPQFDPKLSTSENWAKMGFRYNSYYDRLEKFGKEERESVSTPVEEKTEEKKEEKTNE